MSISNNIENNSGDTYENDKFDIITVSIGDDNINTICSSTEEVSVANTLLNDFLEKSTLILPESVLVKTNFNNNILGKWTNEIEDLVKDWIEQTYEYESIYEKSSKKNGRIYYGTIIPAIITSGINIFLSAVTAAIVGAIANRWSGMSLNIVIAGIALISTILQGLHTTFRMDKQAKKDHRIAKKFASLRIKLQTELVKPLRDRSDATLFTYKYSRKFNEYNEKGKASNRNAANKVSKKLNTKQMTAKTTYEKVTGSQVKEVDIEKGIISHKILDPAKERIIQDELAKFEAEQYHKRMINDLAIQSG